jgi:hypothetical protein
VIDNSAAASWSWPASAASTKVRTASATIAALTALWGLLASLTSPRTAIAAAGVLILATPLLLPRHDRSRQPEPEPELASGRA